MKKEIVWPHGHQAAAMICIMLDAEFIWHGMDPEKYDTPKHRSMGEYGPRRGINRILEALDRFQVKATFFAPGIFAETYPEQLKEIAEAGHEIALHGYRHEDFGGLSKEQQQSALNQGAKAIEQTIGRMPVGFRLPEGGCTEETLTLIQQAGFLYDNSFFDHDIPYRIPGSGAYADMIEIPTRWELIDFPYLAWGDSFPAGNARIAIYDDVLDNWLRELNADYDMGYCYVLSLTPQTIGSPGRMFMVNTVLEQIKRKNIWLATGEEIARYVMSL